MMDSAPGQLRKGVTMPSISKAAGFIGAAAIVAAVGIPTASAQQAGGTINMNATGTFNQQGQATISAPTHVTTMTRSRSSRETWYSRLDARPVHGEFIVSRTPCTGETETWTATVQGPGRFRGSGSVRRPGSWCARAPTAFRSLRQRRTWLATMTAAVAALPERRAVTKPSADTTETSGKTRPPLSADLRSCDRTRTRRRGDD